MSPRQALDFVRKHGIVLEAARGPVPRFAEAVAGGPIRGSWWGHAKGHAIFALTRVIRESKDVLVCRLVGGKITYVHRRLWHALVRLADRFNRDRLSAVREEHTASGAHRTILKRFPLWVPTGVRLAAKKLSVEEAENSLKYRTLPNSSITSGRASTPTRGASDSGFSQVRRTRR
ncbi:MAG: hypothetical protein FD180_4440 [Planctomycetota bacterium]|nr:MAG: hypothetical protein FD180_4440 [Planctomycetota bacterium]